MIKIISLFAIAIILNGCQGTKYNKPFKHNTPLIKDQNIKDTGKSEIAKTLELGPKPVEGDTRKLGKRKKISSEAQRNYLIISDDYPLLKQRVTLKFQNLDFQRFLSYLRQPFIDKTHNNIVIKPVKIHFDTIFWLSEEEWFYVALSDFWSIFDTIFGWLYYEAFYSDRK